MKQSESIIYAELHKITSAKHFIITFDIYMFMNQLYHQCFHILQNIRTGIIGSYNILLNTIVFQIFSAMKSFNIVFIMQTIKECQNDIETRNLYAVENITSHLY